MRRNHGGGDSGGPCAPLRHRDRQISTAEFGDIPGLGQCFQLCPGQAHMQLPVKHRDGGRCGTGIPYGLLNQKGSVLVLRIGHPVGDDRAFQRHNGGAVMQCSGHIRGGGVKRHEMSFDICAAVVLRARVRAVCLSAPSISAAI